MNHLKKGNDLISISIWIEKSCWWARS